MKIWMKSRWRLCSMRRRSLSRTSKTVAPAPQHKEIAVPVGTLSKYAGTYQMRPNVDLTVSLEGDHLVAQLTGQPKFPIFAESETPFFAASLPLYSSSNWPKLSGETPECSFL